MASPASWRRRAAVRRNLAVALSLVGHGVAFLAMFGAMEGQVVSAPSAVGETSPFTVTLVNLAQPADSAAASSAKSLDVLAAKLSNAAPPVYASEHQEAGRLDALTERLRGSGSGGGGEARRPSELWPQPAPASPPNPKQQALSSKATAAAGGQTTASGSSGGLWGRIEPCWRSPAKRSRVPVTLEVAIDRSGNLSRPPRILRDAAGNDEPQLAAEAAALAALAACLPRGDVAFGNRTYTLEFRPE